jgi:hypothetical protein
MRPRRTKHTDSVFSLPGGNEDNDLWVRRGSTDDTPWIESTWELDDEERAAIAAGGTIQLRTWGVGTPPLALYVGPSMEELAR